MIQVHESVTKLEQYAPEQSIDEMFAVECNFFYLVMFFFFSFLHQQGIRANTDNLHS